MKCNTHNKKYMYYNCITWTFTNWTHPRKRHPRAKLQKSVGEIILSVNKQVYESWWNLTFTSKIKLRLRRNFALEAAHFDYAPYTNPEDTGLTSHGAEVCAIPCPPCTIFLLLADSHSNAQTSHCWRCPDLLRTCMKKEWSLSREILFHMLKQAMNSLKVLSLF